MVSEIPIGKVSTYGHIARAAGIASGARMVGWILNSLSGDPDIPCHRVVNRNGELTGKVHFPTADFMQEMLLSEGVEFKDERVILDKYLYIPDSKI